MSPASEGFSQFFSYTQTSSLNPDANLSSNRVHRPQLNCFSFGSDECNQGPNFEMSKMGTDPLGQARGRRLRYPLKKLRRKVASHNTKFVDSLSFGSLDQSNENVTGTSSFPTPNASNNACGGNVIGEEGGHGTGKFCNVECTIGTQGDSMASNTSGENKGFVFAADKSCAEFNHNKGYGAKDNGLQSNSNLKNENAVFGAENSSTGFVFGNTCDSSLKSSLGEGNFLFTASLSDNSTSTKVGEQKSSGTTGLSGAEKMQNFNNSSFVFGATKGDLDSDAKSENKGSVNRNGMQSEFDRSGKFGHVASVLNCKKTSVAAENRNKKPQKEDCGGSIWETVPNMTGKVKLDEHGHSSFVFSTGTSDSEKNCNSFVFGAKENCSTSTANVEKVNHSEYASSKDFIPKSKENAESANEYKKTGTNGAFVFGAGGNEKLSSNGNIKSRNAIDHLSDEKIKNNSDFMTLLNDGVRSNFKFGVGSSSSPGGAFYKIPLSKLLDEMKSFNINDSKGMTGDDRVKDSGSNSHVCSDQLDAAQNNGQMSSEGKSGTTLHYQHKNVNVGGDVKCSDPRKADTKSFNQGKHDSEPDNSYSENVKVRQPVTTKNTNSMSNVTCEGVSSPFAYSGVLGKENQPSNSSESSVHVEQNYSCFGAPPKVENKENFGFTGTPVGPRESFKEFNTANLNESSSTTNLFTELNKKFEFCAQGTSAKEKKLKKTTRKLRERFPRKPSTGESHLYNEGSSPKAYESPGGCSPMEFSPYEHRPDGTPSLATEKEEGDSTSGRQRFHSNENDKKSGEPDNVNSKNLDGCNLKSTPSSSAQDGLSAIRRQYRKKYKLKIGNVLTGKSVAGSAEFCSLASNSSNGNKDKVQCGVAPNYHYNTAREYVEQDTRKVTTKGECEHWRIRGNQAYKSGDLSKAEEFYTKGINSVKDNNVSGICSEPLLLCYSNRAATRMTLGRMREALVDCKSAAALDPSFHKVKIRAANCHLVLGEYQEAMQFYNDCLGSFNRLCLDRRFTIEAANGLHRAQKVAEGMSRSAELMQLRTSDAANSALNVLVDALSISYYSEQLLEMKGEALLLLQRYNEVIELCEQTLHSAEKNVRSNHLSNVDDFESINSPRLWRWRLMLKSHFHLGRLEVALDLIEKQEELKSRTDCGGANPETPIPSAVTIRGLLERKKVGNEAFQSGRHTEAIEHYTAAISSSVESRPFAAICFCNRAAAYQALGQIVDAIADCSLAMALDGNYPKAVSRRATLHEMIRDYKQAIDDLQRLVTILENQLKEQQSCKKNGSSSSSKKELKQARRRLSLMEDMAKKRTSLDLYLILGIKESDTESDIKKAYRKAALRHHPDKVGQFLARNDGGDDGRLWKDIVEKVHEDADRLFKMIGEAYAVLSDADKRSKYNYERDIREFCNSSSRNTKSRRPSDFNSSPYDGGRWSYRHSGRNGNSQNWHESDRDDDRHSWW